MLIALQDTLSLVERFCISTGNEVEVANSSPSTLSSTYLALGKYDLTVFSDSESDFDPQSVNKILKNDRFELIRWGDFYYSPLLVSFVRDKKLLAFVSLELSSLLNTSYYHPKIIKPIIEITSARIKSELDLEAAFYGGIKQSDLYVVVPLTRPDQLFEINRILRETGLLATIKEFDLQERFSEQLPDGADFPIFHRIESDFLISIPHVINKLETDNSLEDLGKVNVRVTIKANSTSEGKIRKHFASFSKHATTSGNKWVAATESPILFTHSLKQILGFRNELRERNGGESFTKTNYLSDLSELANAVEYPYDFHMENNLSFPKINPRLKNFGTSASELYYATEDIVQRYTALYENNLYKGLIKNISDFFPLLITEQDEIVERLEKNKNRATTQITEAHHSISIAVEAIDQRLEHKYSIHIKAVTNLLTQLSAIAKSNLSYPGLGHNSLDWKGFVFVSRLHGYSLKPFEIYTIPNVSVNQPLSSNINWHSLTHEMSHWIFDELNLSSNYQVVIEESIKKMGIVATGNHLEHEKARYDQLVYEYFATWFDYYHFYDEDQILFQTHVWRSWSSISFTEDKIAEYLSRSFLVYAYQKKEALIDAYFDDKEKEFVAAEFRLYVNFMREKISPHIENCIFDSVNKFEVNIALDFAKAVIPIFVNTLDEFCFDEFRRSLHSATTETTECVNAILNGQIYTKKLENPFLIINVLLKYLSNNSLTKEKMWKLETALLFSIGAQVNYD